MGRISRLALLVGGGIGFAGPIGQAAAAPVEQQAGADALASTVEDIVVTARRKEEVSSPPRSPSRRFPRQRSRPAMS